MSLLFITLSLHIRKRHIVPSAFFTFILKTQYTILYVSLILKGMAKSYTNGYVKCQRWGRRLKCNTLRMILEVFMYLRLNLHHFTIQFSFIVQVLRSGLITYYNSQSTRKKMFTINTPVLFWETHILLSNDNVCVEIMWNLFKFSLSFITFISWQEHIMQ